MHTEGETQPRIDQRLVAGRDQGKVPGSAGSNPARRERGVEVANRFALAVRRRAAGKVHDRAPVAEQRILLDAAGHVGDQVVTAERDDAARSLVGQITFQLSTKVRDLREQRLRLPVARMAVSEQRRGSRKMLVFERFDFDPGHRGGTIDQGRRSQTEVWHRISVCPSVCAAYTRAECQRP